MKKDLSIKQNMDAISTDDVPLKRGYFLRYYVQDEDRCSKAVILTTTGIICDLGTSTFKLMVEMYAKRKVVWQQMHTVHGCSSTLNNLQFALEVFVVVLRKFEGAYSLLFKNCA